MHVDGSVLNPSAWIVTRLDTNARLYVLSVGVYSAPLSYDLLLQAPLASNNFQHRVLAAGLRSASGALLSTIDEAGVAGTLDRSVSTPERQVVRRRQATQDLRSVPVTSMEQLGGTLFVTSTGDYGLHSGVPFVKKMVLRRLMSAPGDFFHLPEYGVGLKVKEPLPVQRLVSLRKLIELQLAKEPEIEALSVNLTQYAESNVLLVDVKARVRKTREAFSLSQPFRFG